MEHVAHVPGLPEPRTTLIGRERELDAARSILSHSIARLLTLTGVGGCGKTRLGLQLTADFAPDYPQRVWAVELAPVVDSDLLPIVVADTLGLHEAGSTSSMAVLAAHLRARPAMLLLDNCEHLIDACATFVDTLLNACPELRVIVTSREPLQIAGEQQYRVPPLDTPAPDALAPSGYLVDVVAMSPAVQLFVARAQAALPSFALTSTNASTVARICARLGGIPLAIELAAARVRVLGVEQILERLDDVFQLLTGGSRVAPTRHQTLRAALDWSDALLTENERTMFHRLAVFAGEFQLEAAEALWADGDIAPDEILDVMTGLVNKSIVLVESDDRTAWYHLLEPVRQYALERLVARGEAADVQVRHAAFYLDLAERAAVGLQRSAQVTWLARLEREQGNLRAALEWARQQESASLELRLAVALAPFWEMRGHLTEGLRRLRDVLARGTTDDLWLRARALAGAGRLAFYLEHSLTSRYSEAEELSGESLQLARELGDEQAIATALCDLGMIHRLQGDLARSIVCLQDALAIFRDLDDEHGAAIVLLHLGAATYMQGDRAQGVRWFEESLDRLRALGDLRFAAAAQVLLAATAHDRKAFVQAIELIVEGMTTHELLGDRWFVIFDLFALANVLLDAGRERQGVTFMGAAQSLSEGLGSPVAGAVFAEAISRVDLLRQDDRFESVWVAGYALDMHGAVRAARALLDEPESRGQPSPLTRRQREVAGLLAEGYTDRQIADALFLSVHTVGVHVHNILQRLKLQSRVQVADWLAAHEPPDARPNDKSPRQTP